MLGECLCKAVQYEITGDLPDFYQCHCSQCRKVTGSANNTGTFVKQTHFKWLCGEGAISSFRGEDGYRSDFCYHCGSPVPNPVKETDFMWIPVGTLQLSETDSAKVAAHLHTDSKANWDQICGEAKCYQTQPEFEELCLLLTQNTP